MAGRKKKSSFNSRADVEELIQPAKEDAVMEGKESNPYITQKSEEITPDMVEANYDKILDILNKNHNIKFMNQEQVNGEISEQVASSEELAERELESLGIDMSSGSRGIGGGALLEVCDLVSKLSTQMSLIMESGNWKANRLTANEKIVINTVKVVCRQLLNEAAPPHQASTVRELLASRHLIPDGVLGARGVKTPYLRSGHLKAAGVI